MDRFQRAMVRCGQRTPAATARPGIHPPRQTSAADQWSCSSTVHSTTCTASVAAACGMPLPVPFWLPACLFLSHLFLPPSSAHTPPTPHEEDQRSKCAHNLIWFPHTGTGPARASRGMQAERPKAPTFDSLIGACLIPPLHSASCGVWRRILQLPRVHWIGP